MSHHLDLAPNTNNNHGWWWGKEGQTGRNRAQACWSAQAYGGSLQGEEGQEGFHDSRKKEETQGKSLEYSRLLDAYSFLISYRQLLLRKKAAEELKKEQERKAAERRRIIEERCGKPKNTEDANEGIVCHVANFGGFELGPANMIKLLVVSFEELKRLLLSVTRLMSNLQIEKKNHEQGTHLFLSHL